MRILAIRGSNLASLQGPFEVDFSTGPLAEAGLFAICGPTGAGKSTLLDAMCLALYDTTPRLAAASARQAALPDAGEHSLSQNDPRNLLRRGCGEGHAEVDFVGADGVACRARWQLRRARGRADGRLQAAELSLLRIGDQQALGDGTKTGVLRAIEARIGLSFEQFRRSVLLAQNEFHGFLKAADDERAQLLETLTGTAEFSRISQACFERYREHEQQLKLLRQQLGDELPLTAEARAQLDGAAQACSQQLQTAEAQLQALDAALRWQQQLQLAQQAVDAATAQQLSASAVWRAAADRRLHLQQLDRAREAAILLHQADERARQLDALRAALPPLESAEQATQTDHQHAVQRLLDAQAQRDALRQHHAALQAPMQAARALDAELVAAQPALQAAERRADDATRHCSELRQHLQQLLAQQQQASQARSDAERWLQLHAGWQAIAEQQAHVEAGLDRLAEARERTAKLQHAQQQRQQALTRQQAALAEATRQLLPARTALPSAEAAAADAQTALDALDATRLAHDEQQLQQQQRAQQQAERAWAPLQQLIQQSEALQQEEAALQQSQIETRAQLEALRRERPAAAAAEAQALRALHSLQQACDTSAEALRHQLIDGQPCPVCGAEQHPYVHAALRDSLSALQQQHAQAQAARDAIDQRGHACKAQLTETERRLERVQQQQTLLLAQRSAAEQHWQAAASCPPEHAPASWLEQQRQRLAAAGTALQLRRQALDRAQQRLQHSSAALIAAQQQLRTLETQALRLQAELQQLQTTQQADQHELAQLQLQQQQAIDALDPLLRPLLGAQWLAAPGADAAALRAGVNDWRAQQQQALLQAQQESALQLQHNALTEQLQQREQQASSQQQEAEALRQHWQQRQQHRQQLFAGSHWQGLPLASIEAELAQREHAADARVEVARGACSDSERQLMHARQRLQQQHGAIADLQQPLLSAQQAVQHWLQAQTPAWTLDQLREALQHSASAIDSERRALQQLEQARIAADSELQLHQRQLQQWLAQRPSAAAHADTASRDSAAEQVEALRTQHGELRLQLRHDDARQQRNAELQQQLAAQTAHYQLWAQLNELIGSADGRKFRNIGQQLTLDVLLQHANLQLRQLARRYRLQRLPDSLALIVIDQDMADDKRSVHSLSGGESFLISLALALGLAALSSQQVRVESLFIDEGFGSLDADTLSVAMDALDALYAQGRKVGVISHVQEMTERIGVRIEVSKRSGGASRVQLRQTPRG